MLLQPLVRGRGLVELRAWIARQASPNLKNMAADTPSFWLIWLTLDVGNGSIQVPLRGLVSKALPVLDWE